MEQHDTAGILDSLSGMILAMEECSRVVPEIQEAVRKSEELHQEIHSLSDKAEKTLEKTISKGDDANKKIKSAMDKLARTVKKYDEVQKELDEKLDNIPNAEEMMQRIYELVNRIDKLEENYNERLRSIEKLTRRITFNGVPYNADKYYSIRQLRDMFRMDHLLVVRKIWTGDYCFCVERVDGTYAYGKRYLNGKIERIDSFKLDMEDFQLYFGDYNEEILKQCNSFLSEEK